MPEESPEKPDKRKPTRVRLVGDVISAFRPEVRRGIERGAAWLSRRFPEDATAGGRLRSSVAERIFSILTNEVEEWAKKKGGVIGELTETLVTDSADLFDASFWRKQKEAGTDPVAVRKIKEIRDFWIEARKRIFEAEDPQAEGDHQFQRWETLKSVLDRAGQAEEEATKAAQPEPERPAKNLEPREWLSGAREKAGAGLDKAGLAFGVATKPLDGLNARIRRRTRQRGRFW